ncbi:MAG: Gfo/Idh/MocA family oxidoreductase [Granulosicoccus sp.]|nr:Gfo/Idh/MocA family oxidoreductase [Granulosicoccus sp.]
MLKFAAIGLDHRHIYEQVGRLLELGASCTGFWTDGEPEPLKGFTRRFPELQRVADPAVLYDDPDVQLIVTAAIPRERAGIALRAMHAGKDVMSDKPGVTTLADLQRLRVAVAETGRIWSVNFSERFEVPATQKAAELVAEGRIGRVVQTLGMGPHRLNKPTRPDWFFDTAAYGGILADIGSHQIDQFLIFTGSSDAEIVSSTVANYNNSGTPGLQDFGEIVLRSDRGHGYVRLDWYTPDGLPTWGDGRLTILGTEGYIELRKYVDIAGRDGTNHLFLVDGHGMEHIDCSGQPLPYYQQLISDIEQRSETAMSQAHCFKVMELALRAQSQAVDLGIRT